MEQKRTRSSRKGGSSNVNVRSISNSREVSRRSKGKSRYTYEDGPARASTAYDRDDYYRGNARKQARTAKSQRRRDADMAKAGHRKNVKRRGRRKQSFSKILGVILCILQFVISVILVVNVMFFGMLTDTYILVLIAVLTILFGITLLSQLGTRGKGIPGKVFCIFLCAIMATASLYIGELSGALGKITNDTRTSAMVVAVLKDNSAESIKDAAQYKFGVQYTTGAEQMRSAVSQIEKETGGSITTTEYGSLAEEAKALYEGEVDAIIYNSGYASVLSDQYATFSDDVKVIYQHNIVVSIDSNSGDASMTEPFAVYLSGIDTWGDITEDSRSDVNIIAVINPSTHQVLLVTTPRDYYVPIPGISGGQDDKLTHAGIYGVDVSMATLAELYDTKIDFFGRVNFTSMINIIDALGGVDVVSDAEFDTGPETGVDLHVNKGENHFNGEQALAFCRERHALADGDNARGRHQQAVIEGIINKMMSPAMLRGAMDIINSVSEGVQTNFTEEQIQSLIKTQLRTGAEWEVFSVSAEGYGDKQRCYSSGSSLLYVTVPDQQSVNTITQLINKIEQGVKITDADINGSDAIDGTE